MSVSCPWAYACTAVGTYQTGDGSLHLLAERWDGSEWSFQTVPTPQVAGATFNFATVSCLPVHFCMAVGSYRLPHGTGGVTKNFFARWNGTTWFVNSLPLPPGMTDGSMGAVAAVSCYAASGCEAVGGDASNAPVVYDWDGGHWTAAVNGPASQAGAQLHGLACPSSTFCEAVGWVGNEGPGAAVFAESWDGSSWSSQSLPVGLPQVTTLRSVACVSSLDCTAVGNFYEEVFRNGAFNAAIPWMLHWDGSSWSQGYQPPQNFWLRNSNQITSVSCAYSGACEAVGWQMAERVSPGHEWWIQLQGLGVGAWLNGVSWFAVKGRPTVLIAVGQHVPGLPGIVAYRWTSSGWVSMPMPALPTG